MVGSNPTKDAYRQYLRRTWRTRIPPAWFWLFLVSPFAASWLALLIGVLRYMERRDVRWSPWFGWWL